MFWDNYFVGYVVYLRSLSKRSYFCCWPAWCELLRLVSGPALAGLGRAGPLRRGRAARLEASQSQGEDPVSKTNGQVANEIGLLNGGNRIWGRKWLIHTIISFESLIELPFIVTNFQSVDFLTTSSSGHKCYEVNDLGFCFMQTVGTTQSFSGDIVY